MEIQICKLEISKIDAVARVFTTLSHILGRSSIVPSYVIQAEQTRNTKFFLVGNLDGALFISKRDTNERYTISRLVLIFDNFLNYTTYRRYNECVDDGGRIYNQST